MREGSLLVELSRVVPDGIICFFTSYSHISSVVSQKPLHTHLEYYLAEWNETSIIRDLFDRNLHFIESRDIAESNLSVENYRKACDAGKGAILCCVVRGHISEGVHFNDHYGRCCVVMGVPFQWRCGESET